MNISLTEYWPEFTGSKIADLPVGWKKNTPGGYILGADQIHFIKGMEDTPLSCIDAGKPFCSKDSAAKYATLPQTELDKCTAIVDRSTDVIQCGGSWVGGIFSKSCRVRAAEQIGSSSPNKLAWTRVGIAAAAVVASAVLLVCTSEAHAAVKKKEEDASRNTLLHSIV